MGGVGVAGTWVVGLGGVAVMVGLGGRLGVTVTGVAVRVVTGTWVVGLGGCVDVTGLGVVVTDTGVTTVTPFGVGVGSAPTPAPTKSG